MASKKDSIILESSDKKSISVPQVSLPNGGGALKGIGETFEVNGFSGTGVLSIPIFTTKARGCEPNLSLDYNSGSGNGAFGVGFSLSLPCISRKTDKVIPKYDSSDTFNFSNLYDLTPAMIKNKAGEWVTDERNEEADDAKWLVSSYRPLIEEAFSKIEYWTCESEEQAYWKIMDRENNVSVYGKNPNGRISDPEDQTRIYRWLLEETLDAQGNKIVYSYRQEDNVNVPDKTYENNRSTANKYIESIKYGNYIWNGQEQFAFEVLFDYGEYQGIFDNPAKSDKGWDIRTDCFSTWNQSFEIRFRRLCRNIFMTHRFADKYNGEAFFIRALHLEYDSTGPMSLLKSVKEIGYRKNKDGSYQAKSMPDVELEYTQFNTSGWSFGKLQVEDQRSIPQYLDHNGYTPVDLYGDGIPGLLYCDEDSVYYMKPKGNGIYGKPEEPMLFPMEHNLKDEKYSLQDLDGSGKLSMVVNSLKRRGFYMQSMQGRWDEFKSFESSPLEMSGSNLDMVDMDGDGLAEVVVYEGQTMRYYPSLGLKGYGDPVRINQVFPEQKSNYISEFSGYADIFGDGLFHRVRISSGVVECWPNKGYGHFGEKISLENAPIFDGMLDASRLLIADINGTGTADLVYMYPDRADIFFNMNGNSFSQPVSVKLPGLYDRFSQVVFADVTGSGSQSMVYTRASGADLEHFYCDFTGGQKTYILNQIKNNLGSVTKIKYAPSTKFYFEDMEGGKPWKTILTFPVQVIEMTERIDETTGSKFVTSYKYHHGCFDGVEREFRGFGCVESRDSQFYEQYCAQGLMINSSSNAIEEALYAYPAHKKVWYHTGVAFDKNMQHLNYRDEYYANDKKAYIMPDSSFEMIDMGSSESIRQAYLALKGLVLREEIYGDDGSPKAADPYYVSEYNYNIKQLQPIGQQQYSSFCPHEKETVEYHYERNSEDPKIEHKFVIDIDDYGNVLNSCDICYARRLPVTETTTGDPSNEVYNEQKDIIAEASFMNYIYIVENCWYPGLPCEKNSFQLYGLDTGGDLYFSFENLKSQFQEAMKNKLRFEEQPEKGKMQSRLIEWERNYYWNNALDACLPLYQANNPALLHHYSSAVFSGQQITEVFKGKLQATMLQNDCGYSYIDGYWWNDGTIQQYKKDGFYIPFKVTGPFGDKSELIYDDYNLKAIEIHQYLSATETNTSSLVIDYNTMEPCQITDINQNITQIFFDAMGRIVTQTVFGTLEGKPQGDSSLDEYIELEASFDEVVKPENYDKYLQKATTYFYYDTDAWKDRRQPVCDVQIQRQKHVCDMQQGESLKAEISISYSDGMGKIIEVKKKTENDPFDGSERWLATGRTVYNNKGDQAKKYIPYFTQTPYYEDTVEVVKRLPLPETFSYDPMRRLLRTDTSKGFFKRVDFTPWLVIDYDEDDTVVDSDYYKKHINDSDPQMADEVDALKKATKFYNTPSYKVFDNKGHVFLEVHTDISEQDEEYLYIPFWHRCDIQGNVYEMKDSRIPVPIVTQIFDMKGKILMSKSVDSGDRFKLDNIFGNLIHLWDGRGFHTLIRYDLLHRPKEIYVEGKDSKGLLMNQVVDRIEYGETQQGSEDKNLRGQIFKHYDHAGLVQFDRYDIHSRLLKFRRNLRTDYKNEVDQDKLLLENETFICNKDYDVQGRVNLEDYSSQGGDSSGIALSNMSIKKEYNISGDLNKTLVIYNDGSEKVENIIDNTAYYDQDDVRVKKVWNGNGVVSTNTFELSTMRLCGVKTIRPLLGPQGEQRSTLLQDIKYTYDPAGSITRGWDNSYGTVFNNQQQVNPLMDYTYDALYRLKVAKGRHHPAMSAAPLYKTGKVLPFCTTAAINDATKLENYTQKYKYDTSNNLVEIQNIGNSPSSSWTVTNIIDKISNRGIPESEKQKEYDSSFYDENGNMQKLENLQAISWNYRNNISRADVILRNDDADSDSDYYVYDSRGERVRKISERYKRSTLTEKTEKIYFGSLEIKRIRQNELILDRRTLLVDGDGKCAAITDYWVRDDQKRETANTGVVKLRYQYHNNIGSACVETDAQAEIISYEEYYPYGGTALTATAGEREARAKEYRYSGKELDEATGLYYYGSRYYACWLGRWLNPDQAGMVDGHNLYAFVQDNPVTFEDAGGYGIVRNLRHTKGTTKRKYSRSKDDFLGKKTSIVIPTKEPRRSGRLLERKQKLLKHFQAPKGNIGYYFTGEEITMGLYGSRHTVNAEIKRRLSKDILRGSEPDNVPLCVSSIAIRISSSGIDAFEPVTETVDTKHGKIVRPAYSAGVIVPRDGSGPKEGAAIPHGGVDSSRDDKGHLVPEKGVSDRNASKVNGPDNVIAENWVINQIYKTAFEEGVKKYASNNPDKVVVTIHVPRYTGESQRPDAVTHYMAIDGVIVSAFTFLNSTKTIMARAS